MIAGRSVDNNRCEVLQAGAVPTSLLTAVNAFGNGDMLPRTPHLPESNTGGASESAATAGDLPHSARWAQFDSTGEGEGEGEALYREAVASAAAAALDSYKRSNTGLAHHLSAPTCHVLIFCRSSKTSKRPWARPMSGELLLGGDVWRSPGVAHIPQQKKQRPGRQQHGTDVAMTRRQGGVRRYPPTPPRLGRKHRGLVPATSDPRGSAGSDASMASIASRRANALDEPPASARRRHGNDE